MYETIQQTAQWLRERLPLQPRVAVILGSGLGDFADTLTQATAIPYQEIPHFPVSTVPGHKGRLVTGLVGGRPVMIMQGRFHFYEGYSMKEVTFPVRVMKALGIETLILSNAAGGLNPAFVPGDIMLIRDHINFFPEHPLRGRNDDRLGLRFPDMGDVYTPRLQELARSIARDKAIKLQEGIYVGSQGPTFETPAEYRMFRLLGADATGMSTVPEAIVAHHGGMEVFALSVITNCPGEVVAEVTHQEVQEVALRAQAAMTALVSELIVRL